MKTISEENASGNAQTTMAKVKKKLGRVPNMYQVMANSPAVLSAYVDYSAALSSGTLCSQLSELIASATAEYNKCSYCLSAHQVLGQKVGLSKEEILEGRQFRSDRDKMAKALDFSKKMLEAPASISSDDLLTLRSVGFTDGEVLEIIGNVVRNLLTNYINIVAGTEVDWPEVVEPLDQYA